MRRSIPTVAALAAAALLGLAGAPRTTAAGPCAAAPSPSGRADFHYTGTVQHVRVPVGVIAIRVDARGGHGGQFEHTGAGGAGGRVVASVPVTGGECLNVYVGGWGGGHGGFGWGRGGNRGSTPFPDTSFDGAGGGGASAVSRGAPEEDDTPLVIAGGGGGGGGKGLGHRPGGEGGAGAGGEGPDTPKGHDGFTPPNLPEPGFDEVLGGDGGWGGDGADGGAGQSQYIYPDVGAGGGGGSGWKGGDGGYHWLGRSNEDDLKAAGGGGGGGGSSYAEPTAKDPRYLVAAAACPVGGGAGCDGAVSISWVERPAKVDAYAGNGQAAVITSRFPTPLQAKVTALSGDPVGGVGVTFTLPSAAAGAHFDDGAQGTVAHAVTNRRGIATSPPLIADRTAGPWTGEATVERVAEPALYALANRPAPTATAAYASADPSVAGQPLTFTATVGASPSTVGIPTGSVQFRLDGDDVGGPVALSAAGSATVPAPRLTLGEHRLEARFYGGRDFVPSAATATPRVERGRAAVALGSTENPSSLGDPVKFTATVSAAAPARGTPTGAVQFLVDGTDFGAPVPLQDGTATSLPPTAAELPEGRHVIEAAYAGDASFEPAGGTVEQAVGPAATATVVTSAPSTTVFGEPVAFTATVTSPAGEDPAGAVDFRIGGAAVGCDQVTLDGGEARCAPEEPLAPGAHVVTASYQPGSVDFEPSRGRMTQRVDRGDATVTIGAVPSPSVFGMAYALHAEVAPTAPAAGTPTGAVAFRVDGASLGDPVALGAEGATLPAHPSLTAGPHVVEALYSGDPRFVAARGASTTVVDRAVTAAGVSSSAAAGGAVVFHVGLDVLAPGGGDPGGSVRFIVDGEPRGAAVPIAGGRASSAPVGGLGPGAHDVRARYSGNHDFAPSDATMIQPIGDQGGGDSGARPARGGGGPGARPGRPRALLPPAPGLLCGRAIVLTGAPAGRRVRLSGVARPQLVGRRVTLFAGARRAGRATVRADGSFAGTVRRPRGRRGRRATYRASVASYGSAPLRLARGRVRVVGERVTRRGLRVTFAGPPRRRLLVGRMPGCRRRRARPLRTLRTDSHGRASAMLRRPPAGRWPWAYVAWTPRRASKAAAYSPPIVVRAAHRRPGTGGKVAADH